MENGILKTPIKYVYSEIDEGKCKTTKYYQITESNEKYLLTEKLRISLNRGFAKSKPNIWLSIRLRIWVSFTGLFYNSKYDFYIGDKGHNNKKEDLIIVRFLNYQRTAVVYYFKGYYTDDLDKINHFIN